MTINGLGDGSTPAQRGPGAKPGEGLGDSQKLKQFADIVYCRNDQNFKIAHKFTSSFLTNTFHGGGGLRDIFGELSPSPTPGPATGYCGSAVRE